MLFVAVLLCDFYANCADIMQIVLFLCKLWGFYANSAVLMQIVLFWCKLSHLSQFTLFCRKWHFCRKIRALAGTFGSAIRRRLLLMMSDHTTTIHCTIGLQWWEKNCPHYFAANAFPTSVMHSPIAQPLQAHKASTQHGFQNSMFLQNNFHQRGGEQTCTFNIHNFYRSTASDWTISLCQVSTFVIFPKPLQTVASGRRIWLQLVGEGTRIGTPELL